MVSLKDKGDVCVVMCFSYDDTQSKTWLFSVYDTEELARQRVKDQECILPADCMVTYSRQILWTKGDE